MTAQIKDRVLYQKNKWDLAGVCGWGLFNPKTHGLKPVESHTACYRGWFCAYEVTSVSASLNLKWLVVTTLEREQEEKAGRTQGPTLLGQLPVWEKEVRRWVYDEINAPVAFSGGMLVAKDFLDDMYLYEYRYPACAYGTVLELLFEDGRLIESNNCSAVMEEFRELCQKLRHSARDWSDEKVRQWMSERLQFEYQFAVI